MARFEYDESHRSGRKKPWMAYLPLLFFVGVIALFSFSTNLLSSGTSSRQMESLRSALMNDITYCYATTGRYPMDLEEIKSNYGLTYDEDMFFVDYRVSGSNIFPDVTILERK